MPKDVNFIEQFIYLSQEYPDLPAYEIEGTDILYTYQELKQKIEEWIGYFQQLNLREGDPILILLSDEPEFIFSFFASCSLKLIAGFYDSKATDYEIDQIFKSLEPKIIISSNDYLKGRDFSIFQDTPCTVLCTTPKASLNDIQGEVIFAEELPIAKGNLQSPKRECVISSHFTYKGLGYPLQVRHTYGEYCAFLQQSLNIFPQTIGGIHLICLPCYPIYGISSSILYPLICGCKLLVCKNIVRKNILELLELYQIDLVCLVPLLVEKLLREAETDTKRKLNPFLHVITGSSYLSKEIQEKVYKLLGFEIYQGYGLTETFPISFTSRDQNVPGSIGMVQREYTDLEIVDSLGNRLGSNQVGEIIVKGKTVIASYHQQPEVAVNLFFGDYLRTGDLGFVDDNGYLHFVGRKLPFGKIVSKMIDLTEIEDLVQHHTGADKVRAVIHKHKKTGKYVCVYIKSNYQMTLDEKGIKELCKKYLSKHKIPRKVVIYKEENEINE